MSATTDDPWADLYTELEVENAAKAATPPPLPAEAVDDDDTEDADDGPDEGEGEVGGEGDAPLADGEQPKKRRRRRRRRKGGKGPGGEPLPGDGEGVAATGGDDHSPEAGAADMEDEPGEEEAEPADQSREMIRTWNVPSWSEIVAGLHRG